MKKTITKLMAALALLLLVMPPLTGWGQTRSTVTDVLNRELTGVSGNSYTAWSGKTSNSTAVWAGNSAGGNSSIQLRSNNNNSGIITTESGGTVKKITVVWNSNTVSGRTLNVYGKDSAYSSPEDLYNNNQGTLLGSIVCGTSTELIITGSYEYIGMRSSSGAMYLTQIDVKWEVADGDSPSITASNVEIDYDTEEASIAYSISNYVEGEMTASSDVEWLHGFSDNYTGGDNHEGTVVFSADENEGFERSATVTLTFTYGEDQTVTKSVSVTQGANPNIPGTQGNPYTVAQAIANTPASGQSDWVYIHGIVSSFYNTSIVGDGSNYRYHVSDDGTTDTQLLVYRGKGLNNQPFTNADDLLVGDEVVICGKLTMYQSAPEVAADNYLVSLVRPEVLVEAPTFSPEAGLYEEAQQVSISCETEGVDIYFTLDGSIPTMDSQMYEDPITVSQTTTIKAIAVDGNDNISAVAMATYTIVSVSNISDITEVGTAYTVRGTVVATNSRGFVMGDGTGYVYYYKNGAVAQSVGDMVKVSGTTGTYGQIIQFTNTATVAEAATSNYDGTPAAVSITEVPDYSEGYHLSTYLDFVGLLNKSGNNWFITLGDAQIQISYPTTDQSSAMNDLNNEVVRVKGYFSGINSTGKFTVMLESVEVVPSITVTPTMIEAPAEGASGSLAMTLAAIANNTVEVRWFDEDGVEVAEYNHDWIATSVTESGIDYTIGPNAELYDRVAYFKVVGWDIDGNEVQSALVTVTQAHPEAPQPVVNIDPYTVNLEASANEGTLSVSISNCDISSITYAYFMFYRPDGNGGYDEYDEEEDDPEWIGLTIDAPYETINYTVEANEGETRTAYFKLVISLGGTRVYSDMIILTQRHQVLESSWVLTDLADLTADDVFVIVGTDSNGDGFAMSNDKGTGAAPAAVSVTVVDDMLSEEPAANIQWNLSITENGYVFYPNGDTESWLYCNTTNGSGSNNNMRVGDGNRNVFTIDNDGYMITNDDYATRYMSVYNSTDWRGYANTNNNPVAISFYKKVSGASITVTPDEVTLDAGQHIANYLELSYENIQIDSVQSFVVHYYNTEGQEIQLVQGETWMIAGVVMPENDVYQVLFTVIANEGEARTVCFRVSCGETYSNLVTINQEGAAAPNYTIIFNENGYDVETMEVPAGVIGANLPDAAFASEPANAKFVGWSLTPVTDYNGGNYYTTEAPVMVDTTYNLTGDVTFYAVYVTVRNEEYGDEGWVKVTSTEDFLSGQEFLIVNEANGKAAGALQNYVMTPYDVTFEDGMITSVLPDTAIRLVLWSLVDEEDSYGLRYETDDSSNPLNGYWLTATAAKKLTWISPGDTATYDRSKFSWNISFDANGNAVIQNGMESYGRFLYNVSSPRFTTYTSNLSSNLFLPQLYRKQGVPTEYYEYYFSQITELTESVTITGNEVWPYNCTTADEAVVSIENGGVLTVEGLLFNLDPTQLVIKDGGQLKMTNKVRAGTIQKNIQGYVDEENEGNYYLLGVPQMMSYNKAVNSGMIGQFPNFGDVDVYHFAQGNSTYWLNMKTDYIEGRVDAFFGAIVFEPFLYANKNDVVLNFATDADESEDGFLPTNVDQYAMAVRIADAPQFIGWNLIRNPYTCDAYLRSGRDFYRMNAAGDAIVLANDDNGGNVIKPCEAVFVVVTENDPEDAFPYLPGMLYNIYFTTTEPAVPQEENAMLNVTVSRNGQSLDAARVRFSGDAMIGKMVFKENTTRLSLAKDSKDYSVVRSDAQGEMPVNFKAASAGTYTITVDADNVEMEYLHLIDNMTGDDIDLLATPSYTFDAKNTDYTSRFKLVFNASEGDGTSTDATFAFFNGSEWTISNTGRATLQVVDMLGRIVSSESINGNASLSTSNLVEGVYMFRLVSGDDVKVQKVVVR